MIAVLIALAVVPPLILLLITYILDRKEREPFSLLMTIFLLGGASALPAGIYELIACDILEKAQLPVLVSLFIEAFFIVALCEEGFKFFVMHGITWHHPAFNYRFDGIVYCVYSSLGFATIENILYVVQDGVQSGIVRAFISVPFHAYFGVVMGIFYGYAKGCSYAKNKKGYIKNTILALLIPIEIHGFYDFCIFTEDTFLILLWMLFIVVMSVTVIVNLISSSRRNHMIISPENNIPVFGSEDSWFPQENSKRQFVKWSCSCGLENMSNYCPMCGRKREDSLQEDGAGQENIGA